MLSYELHLAAKPVPVRFPETAAGKHKRSQGFATDSRVLRAPCRITGDGTEESEKIVGKSPFSVLPSWLTLT